MAERLGIRARFTLLYGTALIVTVLLVSGGIYFFVQQAMMRQVEGHLQKDLATLGAYLRTDVDHLFMAAEHGPIRMFSVIEGKTPIVSSAEWTAGNLGPAVSPDTPGSFFSAKSDQGKSYRFLTGSFEVRGHTYRVAVAHGETFVKQTLNTLAIIIMLILPLAVGISLGIGYLIAGRVLAPISAITRKAEEIGAENLSERLPIGEGNDELSRLAAVFNQTFARIEDSFTRLRRFTADASHELRTPLAAIRSIGETAVHTAGIHCTCRDAIGSILEETDRLRQMIDSLLQLSRGDSAEIELRREPVDLAELARETVELLSVLAEEKRQTLALSPFRRVVVQIDRVSVRQALTNLLDNAIKYSPADSEITVTVGVSNDGEAFVEIADRGMGIPEHDLQRIFDRFYRIDKGRSREMGGSGLGLSITKWAVECNGGRIEVTSSLEQGSAFRVLFPPIP